MTHISKKTWGNSVLKYDPIAKKVWQIKYDTYKNEKVVVIYNDMPTYGLDRQPIPEDIIHKSSV